MMHITEVASWTPADGDDVFDHEDRIDAASFAVECSPGFHTHSNGMIHISIELTDAEREQYRKFIADYYRA